MSVATNNSMQVLGCLCSCCSACPAATIDGHGGCPRVYSDNWQHSRRADHALPQSSLFTLTESYPRASFELVIPVAPGPCEVVGDVQSGLIRMPFPWREYYQYQVRNRGAAQQSAAYRVLLIAAYYGCRLRRYAGAVTPTSYQVSYSTFVHNSSNQ